MMDHRVAERVIELLANSPSVEVLDLTGGAPELNPHFRWLVTEARRLGRRVIDRCNLTVLFEPGQEDLAPFLAAHEVELVASLPCYGPKNVELQRGRGTFDKSIRALRSLNALGYGHPESSLALSLVYNPVGASLPPEQSTLEATYRQVLSKEFDVVFDTLLTITNMPIHRFAHALERDGKLEEYLTLLVNSFNPGTIADLMCRSLVSVSYDGGLFDCDFNQMLGLPAGAGARTIWDIQSLAELEGGMVATESHCFGCTAGHGSSCSGALR
jgi:radical SAM/Cys-rich protein